MIRNHFKIALRNLIRHKAYSVINIGGLAVGITCCILILLYVRDELSFDRFHDEAARIYRVGFKGKVSTETWQTARTPHPLAPSLVREFPELQKAVRIQRMYRPLVIAGDKKFHEENFYYTDPAIFDVFTFPLLHGDAATALSKPFTVVLTQEMAAKYFHTENPVGEQISILNVGEFTVTGVARNVPFNSHLRFDFLTAYETLRATGARNLVRWDNFVTSTYAHLPKRHDVGKFEQKLQALVDRHMSDANSETDSFFLTPLLDLHLRSKLSGEIGTGGEAKYIYIFSCLALFILSIGCINFMNLSTARSLQRAREVGVRKVMGSVRSQLVRQFLAEAILMAYIALALALVFSELALPVFNTLADKQLDIRYGSDWPLLLLLAGIGLLTGILAGSYPAFHLSSFRPAAVLKGGLDHNVSLRRLLTPASLRQGLVLTQFALSVICIVSTFIISNQLDYFRNKDLGFDQEQVVVMRVQDRAMQPQFETVKHELLSHPDVLKVAASGFVPGRGRGVYGYQLEGVAQIQNVVTYFTDHDFVSTMGMEIASGRDFSNLLETDLSAAFIVNETAAKHFGWEEPLQKKVTWDGSKSGVVVGVVRDFHYQSLHQTIEPVIMHIEPDYLRYLVVRLSGSSISSTLGFIEQTWARFDTQNPFSYTFLDDDFERQYLSEQRLSTIFDYASILTVVIACLGLFGLASFTTAQRNKEIGVRKVLGASVVKIVRLLSTGFARLVLMANIVAWPIVYFAMNKWLQDFAYRIEIGPQSFLMGALLTFVVALLTVSFQAVKAATANPVEALRYE